MIKAIVARSKNNVIGIGPEIPWHIPEDFKYFKKITGTSTVIMGRKTFDSIGRPLPNRINIVVTRNKENVDNPNVIKVTSLEEALRKAPNDRDVFFIGGSTIYNQALEAGLVKRLYVTEIDIEVDEDSDDVVKFEFDDTVFARVERTESTTLNKKTGSDVDVTYDVYEHTGVIRLQ